MLPLLTWVFSQMLLHLGVGTSIMSCNLVLHALASVWEKGQQNIVQIQKYFINKLCA